MNQQALEPRSPGILRLLALLVGGLYFFVAAVLALALSLATKIFDQESAEHLRVRSHELGGSSSKQFLQFGKGFPTWIIRVARMIGQLLAGLTLLLVAAVAFVLGLIAIPFEGRSRGGLHRRARQLMNQSNEWFMRFGLTFSQSRSKTPGPGVA